jgi:hypothetical protein
MRFINSGGSTTDESHGAPTEIPSPIGLALRTQATTILHAKYHVIGAEDEATTINVEWLTTDGDV